jgi:hypothetical protein
MEAIKPRQYYICPLIGWRRQQSCWKILPEFNYFERIKLQQVNQDKYNRTD